MTIFANLQNIPGIHQRDEVVNLFILSLVVIV